MADILLRLGHHVTALLRREQTLALRLLLDKPEQFQCPRAVEHLTADCLSPVHGQTAVFTDIADLIGDRCKQPPLVGVLPSAAGEILHAAGLQTPDNRKQPVIQPGLPLKQNRSVNITGDHFNHRHFPFALYVLNHILSQ